METADQGFGIFLSHNHADKPFVRELAADLAAFGLRPWVDEAALNIGDSLIQRISEEIDRARYFIVVLSPNSIASRWVKEDLERPLNLEIAGREIKVLPLLLKDCGLPGFLQGRLYADFRHREQYDTELRKLLRGTTPTADAWIGFRNAWDAVQHELRVSQRRLGGVPASNYRATAGRMSRAKIFPPVTIETMSDIRRLYQAAKRSRDIQRLTMDEAIVFVRRCNRFVRDLREHIASVTARTTEHAISPKLLDRLRSVMLDGKMFEDTVAVLRHDSYPKIMSLAGELVLNPVWTEALHDVEERLGSDFRPDGSTPPRIMALDIFLIKAADSLGRPNVLTYFSGKPRSGWRAFLFPFRHRHTIETDRTRAMLNAKDLASFLGVSGNSLSVADLDGKYAVSVKPDPGYGELVVYLFTFCSVRLAALPDWLAARETQCNLESTTRRFHWFHPEELEQDEAAMRVNADLIRAIHYLFSTTMPSVPLSVAPRFLTD